MLLRVLNESLANAERHSGAGSVSVVVSADKESLRLRVTDEGVGLDPDNLASTADGHFGLGIMRARAVSVGGTISISGRLGVGTSIDLRVPLGEP